MAELGFKTQKVLLQGLSVLLKVPTMRENRGSLRFGP